VIAAIAALTLSVLSIGWPTSPAYAQCAPSGTDNICINNGVLTTPLGGAGTNNFVSNSGAVIVGGFFAVSAAAGGSNIVNNSGILMGNGFGVSTASGASNTINNSGVIAGTDFGISAATGGVNTFNNFGTISGPTFSISGAAGGANILTSYAGSRLIGPVSFSAGGFNAFNFVGGNYLYTFSSAAPVTLFNASGAPFVVNNTTGQVAVLDPTAISLTDRTLMQFSGGISSMIQGRLNGPTLSGATMQAVTFAPVPTSPIAGQASDVFAEIPSLMAYAPGGRMVTKAPPIAPVVGTTTVWRRDSAACAIRTPPARCWTAAAPHTAASSASTA
jgi:hypothetical protein